MDGLWDDDDIIPRSPKKQEQPLFLASPSASPQKTRGGASTAAAHADLNDLDELFADIDNLEARPPRRSGRGEASGSKSKSARPTTVTALISDDEDETGSPGAANDAAKDDDEDGKKKPRRKPVKLDENRLLGKTGFPALIEQHRKFKPSGKGNEAKDLKRLLQMYQFWTIKMYPKTDFRETAEKVEKLCRSRRMHNALNSYKHDLEHANDGPLHEVTGDIPSENEDGSGNEAPIRAPNFTSSPNEPDSTTAASTSGHGQDPRPGGLEDMVEADRAERRAAEERDRLAAAARPPVVVKRKVVRSGGPMEDDWDLDAMLEEEEETQAHLRGGVQLEPDFDIDMHMDEEQPPTQTQHPSQPQPLTPSIPDEFMDDEEMWDMAAEMHPD